MSYAQLWERVERTCAALQRRGVDVGDRVALYSDKRVDAVVMIFAAAAAGAICVPMNPLLRPPQVAHILGDCAVRVLVATTERLALLGQDPGGWDSVELVVTLDDAPAEAERFSSCTMEELLEGVAPRVLSDPVIDLDPAAIFYTSGSTGKPKGVVVSHRNLVAGAESVSGYLGNCSSDRILAMLPLSFDAGFSQLTTGFAAGAEIVLHDYLLPKDVVRACAARKITGMTGVPPLWIQLAEQQWPTEATEALRYFASTGGKMPRTTLRRLREHFPVADPYLMYGLTEAFRSTYLDPSEVDRRPDSIGKAIPNAEILLLAEDGSRCAPGEEGELVHRGALVALGYWGDPVRTAERFRPLPETLAGAREEIAVWSGDMAVADEEGFLYFVARGDEMIKTSGYRVSPAEIEEAAYETRLVTEAAALGVEDERLGQRIVLAVAPPDGAEQVDVRGLLAALRKTLPGYMLPRHVETMPKLPRSANGKFDRVAIRDLVAGS